MVQFHVHMIKTRFHKKCDWDQTMQKRKAFHTLTTIVFIQVWCLGGFDCILNIFALNICISHVDQTQVYPVYEILSSPFPHIQMTSNFLLRFDKQDDGEHGTCRHFRFVCWWNVRLIDASALSFVDDIKIHMQTCKMLFH